MGARESKMTMREILDRMRGPKDLSRRTEALTPELREALMQLVEAWTVEGPSPEFHKDAMLALKQEWPTLERAVQQVIAAFLS
jgi:uncharacterized protein YukE